MSYETPLITAAQLRASLTEEVYVAIFDDQRTGVISVIDKSDGVAEVLDDAHAFVISGIGPIYERLPQSTDPKVPKLLIAAERQWARALSFERRPEWTHEYGYGRMKETSEARAKWIIGEIRAALMRIVDVPPEPKPRNVGGTVVDSGQRVFLASPDGTLNSGDF